MATIQVAHAAPLPVEEAPEPPPKPKADATACNCYLYVKSFVPKLPRSALLTPNWKTREGRVAIFDYNGLPHYAIIGEVVEGVGFYIAHESNFKRCQYSVGRFVRFDDPRYLGAWWSDDM